MKHKSEEDSGVKDSFLERYGLVRCSKKKIEILKNSESRFKGLVKEMLSTAQSELPSSSDDSPLSVS
jgi:hypothetical protein